MNVERLNINVNGVRVEPLSVDRTVLSRVENYLGFGLPSCYIDFVSRANGGHPELDSFFVGDGASFEVSWFYLIEELPAIIDTWRHIIGAGNLPFARDGGGNQFCLDVREVSCPVYIFLVEGERQLYLSSDFESFINALQKNPDYI